MLFWHFFSVAFLSLWVLFRESALYMLPFFPFQSISVFVTACVVIFPYIYMELLK